MNDYLDDLVKRATDKILKYTPQLFIHLNAGKPEPFATGVLLQVDDHYFLITAAHVIDGLDPKTVGIMINNTFYILNGTVHYTQLSSSKQNASIDLAIWLLSSEVVAELKQKYSFLQLSEVSAEHVIIDKPQYLVVGFPVTRTKLNLRKAKLAVQPFIFLTNQAEPKLYSKLRFTEQSHILLAYRKAKIKNFESGLVVQGPDPHGVSGSGLWFLPEVIVEPEKDVPIELVGIMTEFHSQLNVLVSTRIHLVLEILRKLHYEK